jgi:hypothetical protein
MCSGLGGFAQAILCLIKQRARKALLLHDYIVWCSCHSKTTDSGVYALAVLFNHLQDFL